MSKSTAPRLAVSIITMILLFLCLLGMTAALFYTTSELKATASTPTVKINLNDGKPVIDTTDPAEAHHFFEPGMTVVKDCFVENTGTLDIYYRVYMSDVTGTLATILEVTVLDGEQELYSGTIGDMTHDAVLAGSLAIGERRDLKVIFHYPTHATNTSQNTKLTFVLTADAIQQRNTDPLDPFNS